jgi:cysteine desulfuration protein SufE
MTTSISEALAELAGEFEFLGDWEERYRYVIELGRELANP